MLESTLKTHKILLPQASFSSLYTQEKGALVQSKIQFAC